MAHVQFEAAGARSTARPASHAAAAVRGLAVALILALGLPAASNGAGAAECLTGDDYVLIGWNDLGMHCINPSYKTLALLPPFHNLWAQVVKRGEPPQVVTTGVTLTYSIVNNTTVRNKTDFWEHDLQLFGANLPEGVGLT